MAYAVYQTPMAIIEPLVSLTPPSPPCDKPANLLSMSTSPSLSLPSLDCLGKNTNDNKEYESLPPSLTPRPSVSPSSSILLPILGDDQESYGPFLPSLARRTTCFDLVSNLSEYQKGHETSGTSKKRPASSVASSSMPHRPCYIKQRKTSAHALCA